MPVIERVADAEQRYRGMYGFHNNEYIKVNSILGTDDNIRARIRKMGNAEDLEVPIAELNMNKFEFGFMFNPYDNYGYFLSKLPVRETKQGISARNVTADVMSRQNGLLTNWDNLIRSKFFVEMLKGNFEFDKERMCYLADKAIEERLPHTHYPISRNFSLYPSKELSNTLLVTYMGEFAVGVFDNNAVILNKGCDSYNGQLNRAGINTK